MKVELTHWNDLGISPLPVEELASSVDVGPPSAYILALRPIGISHPQKSHLL